MSGFCGFGHLRYVIDSYEQCVHTLSSIPGQVRSLTLWGLRQITELYENDKVHKVASRTFQRPEEFNTEARRR